MTPEQVSQRAATSAKVIGSFLTDDSNRHLYAARRRRAMNAVIADGGDAQSFEIVGWIRSCAREIVSLMSMRGYEYDGAHPWDKATRADVKDVIETALGMLRS